MHLPKTMAGLAVLILVGAAAVACGGDGDGNDNGDQDEPTPPDSKVAATLTEWAIEYAAHPPEGAVGTVEFTVRNDGDVVHAFAIHQGGSLVGDSIDRGEPVGRTGNIGPGETVTLQRFLEPGDYWLVCPIPGHTALGMAAQLAVGS